MLSLSQLITPVTQAQALQTILNVLSQAGFQATSWQSGSIQLTLLNLFANTWSNLTQTIANIAAGGFTSLATGNWLTLVAQYIYGINRLNATSTVGTMVLASTAPGTTTFNAGDIIVSNSPSGTPGAQTFTVSVGGSVLSGGTLSVAFTANTPGSAGNIAPNSTLYLWTPIPGITVTNPVISGTSTWITSPGQDAETDARLAARCLAKWSQLSYGNVNGAYAGWAFAALPTLTRVSVQSSPGNGNITVIGANSLGPISNGDCTTIANYINGVTDGVGRRPINDILTVTPATTYSPAYTPTLNVRPDVVNTIAATVTNALNAYCGTIPIGGFKLLGGSGIVPFAQLIAIAQGIDGVRSLSGFPTADVSLTSTQIFTPSWAFTVNQVAPSA